MKGSLRSLAVLLSLAASTALGAEDPFTVQILASSGRTVTAELVDLDGDGRQDLLHAVIFGMPPTEQRVLRVHLQRGDGTIPDAYDLEVRIPEPCAAYDLAEVDGIPGAEVLFLQPRGVGSMSFERGADGALGTRFRQAKIPEDVTIGVASDERGFDRHRIASFDFGDRPWLIVPGMGETFFLSPVGDLRARIRSGSRANYFLQPPGPMMTESDIQLFFDAPRISVGDVNGDARPDIVASSRHELRLFFQNEDGGYARDPDEAIPLGRVTLEDHIRGTGSVRSVARDLDGDGLLDLLLSLTVGGVMNAHSNTTVYFNRGQGWDLADPDVAFETEKALSADQLIDLDSDGNVEIVRMGISIGILELVEIFLQRELDVSVRAYRLAPREAEGATIENPEPLFETKLDVPLDFETSRPAGFIPTIDFDVNGDGFSDYLDASDGTRLDVYLGSEKNGLARSATQEISTEGQIRAGDLDADGLPDFVLFNSRRLDEPVRIVKNRGVLPGTPKRPVDDAAVE